MSWAEIKKAVNDNFNYPLNKQKYLPRTFAFIGSGTFTVPATGWYLVTCVGAGGKGGDGQGTSSQPWRRFGGGGGSGGISISKLSLTKNATVSVTINASTSSFGSYLSATAGGAGSSNGSLTGLPTAGAAGTATGGNIINLAGNPGKAASDGTSDGFICCGGSTRLQTLNATNYTQKYIYVTEGITTFHNTEYANWGGVGYNPLSHLSVGGLRTSNAVAQSGMNGGGDSGRSYINASDGEAVGGGGGCGYGAGGGGGYASEASANYGYGGNGGKGLVYIELLEELFG